MKPPLSMKARQRAEGERHQLDLRADVVSKSGIDQQVSARMLYEHRRHGEVAPLEGRATAVAKGGRSMQEPGGQRMQRHGLGRCSAR